MYWQTRGIKNTTQHTYTYVCVRVLFRPWQLKEKSSKTGGSKEGRGRRVPEVTCKLRWNADAANQTRGDGARLGGAGSRQ